LPDVGRALGMRPVRVRGAEVVQLHPAAAAGVQGGAVRPAVVAGPPLCARDELHDVPLGVQVSRVQRRTTSSPYSRSTVRVSPFTHAVECASARSTITMRWPSGQSAGTS